MFQKASAALTLFFVSALLGETQAQVWLDLIGKTGQEVILRPEMRTVRCPRARRGLKGRGRWICENGVVEKIEFTLDDPDEGGVDSYYEQFQMPCDSLWGGVGSGEVDFTSKGDECQLAEMSFYGRNQVCKRAGASVTLKLTCSENGAKVRVEDKSWGDFSGYPKETLVGRTYAYSYDPDSTTVEMSYTIN